MELPSITSWLSELGMEEPALIHQYFNLSTQQHVTSQPTTHLKVNATTTASASPPPPRTSWTTVAASAPPSSSKIISFGPVDRDSVDYHSYGGHEQVQGGVSPGKRMGGSLARTGVQAKEHVLAERRRRRKLSKRLIALSTLVPGLKKMDKASILGDAIEYMKQLQQRINTLEEQNKNRTTESIGFVTKKSLIISDENGNYSSDESFESETRYLLPEIEVKVSRRNVLIRVYCEKKQGTLIKVMNEINKLLLTTINTSTMPFANYAVCITIIAQMENELCMTAEDLLKHLKHSLQRL